MMNMPYTAFWLRRKAPLACCKPDTAKRSSNAEKGLREVFVMVQVQRPGQDTSRFYISAPLQSCGTAYAASGC